MNKFKTRQTRHTRHNPSQVLPDSRPAWHAMTTIPEPVQVLAHLQAVGLTVALDGDRLMPLPQDRAKAVLTPEWVTRAQRAKSALLWAFSGPGEARLRDLFHDAAANAFEGELIAISPEWQDQLLAELLTYERALRLVTDTRAEVQA